MHGLMMDYPLTLTHILERAGTLHRDREIATRLPDKSIHRYDFGAFYERTRRLANALQAAGLQPGDRVATMMWNTHVHLEAYFAIPAAGGVLHTLNFRLHADDIAYIVNHAEDRFIIVDDVLLPLFEQFKDKIKPERIIVSTLGGASDIGDYQTYESFIADASSDFTYPEIGENDACGMCYTSGTTGRPKGVLYSHRAVVLHTLALGMTDMFALTQRDTLMPVVPMFHANAWGTPFAAAFLGMRTVMPGAHLDAESLLELCDQEQVTIAAGVPTIWMGILQALDKEPGRWKLNPNLRTVVGGSAVTESMMRGFDKHGVRTVHAWGMTEMTPLGLVSNLKATMTDLTEDETYRVLTRQGTAVPLVDVRIFNDEGVAPWDGETMGELQVRGPWVSSGYYNPDEPSDKWTDDGWFGTGDVATIDTEGYVKLTDRTKDLIKTGGEWISSVDLENAIMGHPAVKEAAVIAVAHPKWDERPLAVVVLKDGASATAEDLTEHLRADFAKWWLPDGYVFAVEIPRTSTGKFLKTALREQYGNWSWD
jgi:fatty-acyl-CoA synthase